MTVPMLTVVWQSQHQSHPIYVSLCIHVCIDQLPGSVMIQCHFHMAKSSFTYPGPIRWSLLPTFHVVLHWCRPIHQWHPWYSSCDVNWNVGTIKMLNWIYYEYLMQTARRQRTNSEQADTTKPQRSIMTMWGSLRIVPIRYIWCIRLQIMDRNHTK